jgi:transcriptional regulator with XRE-family HTH domain
MTPDLKIHIVLKRLLKERGNLSISELSRRTGVPHSTISTWLLPKAKPKDPSQIAAVAKELGTTMHYLLFEELENEVTLETLPTTPVLEGLYRVILQKVILPHSEIKFKK